jgi:hypothetical protein
MGSTMELDRQEMWRNYRRSGVRNITEGDRQALFLIELVSAAAIRLGITLMPSRPPHF